MRKDSIFEIDLSTVAYDGLRLTHGLLAHSTLVCVPRGLVMVGVGDETSTYSKQREGLDLQVCCLSA